MSTLAIPILLLGLFAIFWLLNVIERKGWIKLRSTSRSSRASGAFCELQAILQPRVVHIEEAKRERKQHSETADDTDPDDQNYFR